MTRIYDIAQRYVDELAALDPITATSLGLPGYERQMTDFSPEGVAAIAALNRRTVGELESAPLGEGERDRIAREVMLERLGVQLDLFQAGEHLRAVRILASPLQRARDVFDQMPKETAEQWADIAARLRLVPEALAGYRRTLAEGLRRGQAASRRQAREAALQSETYAGLVAGKRSFFDMLAEAFESSLRSQGSPSTGSGRTEGTGSGRTEGTGAGRMEGVGLDEGVRAAKEGYAETARYLREEYLPRASEREAAGPERYALLSRVFLGAEIDPRETYEWGWEELYRIEAEMAATAERIAPGEGLNGAMRLLETDPSRVIEGAEAYRAWLQQVHDEAVASLDGTHFEIEPRIRRIEVMVPPPGGSLAPYYTGPSEDFQRPGRTWWPLGSRTSFPKWREVSTAYHEGVPGHHLQVGSARALGEELSRYQRLLTFVSGYGEGWALYAERLMGELGYLEDADYYLGMLSAQALRAVRVIIDIGMHLELRIPRSERFHPGEVWDHDLALAFAIERSGWPAEMMASEVVRYLGWPSQAICYKVGERMWLAVREAAKRRLGEGFALKRFHSEALDLGPMGLGQLEREMGGSWELRVES